MNNFESLTNRRTEKPFLPAIRPDEDPLRVEDALQEAQILDVRCECVTQTVGILLEMRMAFAGGANLAALIVGRGVRDFGWECTKTNTGDGSSFGHAWTIGDTIVTRDGTLLKLRIVGISNAQLRVSAHDFEYYLAEVPGLDSAPPDYGEGPDEVVRTNLPDWKRPVTLVGSSWRVAD